MEEALPPALVAALPTATGFDRQAAPELFAVEEGVVACARCPRLRTHCEQVAREKRRAYRTEEYWGRPLPAFGDPQARLLIVGLAPAAHGANRTGRMFTGDDSGNWLYAALHGAGFASQSGATGRGDGMVLRDAFITAANRCAPPQNKPTAQERAACLPWLVAEIALLKRLRVVVVLGRIAYEQYLRALREMGITVPSPKPKFEHGSRYSIGPPGAELIASYHPSRQNTNTGVLTRSMWEDVFAEGRRLCDLR